MTLTLRAVSLNDLPLSQPITAHFDAAGGTIGRADHNTLALPDPQRHISRQQAAIIAEGGVYRIRNVGSANPVIVRGRPLAQGESTLLAERDQLRIGGYVLEVLEDGLDPGAEAVTRGRAAVEAATPAPPRPGPARAMPPDRPAAPAAIDPFAGLADPAALRAPLSAGNPFADLLAPAPGAPASAPGARTPARTPAPRHAGLAPPAGLRDDSAALAPPAPPPTPVPGGDPFARRAPAPGPARWHDDPFADLVPPAPDASEASIDRWLGADAQRALDDFAQAAPSPESFPQAARAAPDPALGLLSTDPLALFAAPEAAAAPMPDHAPALEDLYPLPRGAPAPAAMIPTGWFRPAAEPAAAPADPPAASAGEAPATGAVAASPRALERHVPPAPPAAAPSHPATAGPSPATAARPAHASPPDVLWQAFCEGAGLDLPPTDGHLQPAQMRLIGQLLRSAVDGTLQLTAVRATTRHEMHAEVTVIRAKGNNPLKFSPDGEAALAQLLQPPMRGFLPGPAAMADAMTDLVGHAIGSVAGTRAALEGVLGRFTPEALQAKLTSSSMLDAVLPMNRKAKLWELYLQHHRAIHDEAQEDFHALFGRAFLAAYEQQVERLRHEGRDAGRRAAPADAATPRRGPSDSAA